MIRTHKIRLYPNNGQETYLTQCCGTARFAYNTCLAKWNEDYENDSQTRHSFYTIKQWFNSRKPKDFPWVYAYSKHICDSAIKDLANAFVSFFKGNAKHPRFHKRGYKDSFRIDGSVVKTEGKILCLPKGQRYRMTERLRYDDAKIMNVTVSRTANRWFVSICCELPDTLGESQSGCVGIDLGIKELATLSDGTRIRNPKVFAKGERRMKHLQRNLSRKRKGSSNWRKAKDKLAKYQYETSCMRKDWIHKATTGIAEKYGTVFMEDLDVKGMLGNHRLAKSLSDVSFGEFNRQLEYKTTVNRIDRFYPSTKTCSKCGHIQDMPLSKRVYDCPVCGNSIDRDLNAAINILNVGMANYPELMPVEGLDTHRVEISMKQEFTSKQMFA